MGFEIIKYWKKNIIKNISKYYKKVVVKLKFYIKA